MRDRGFLNQENKLAKDLISDHKDLPLLSVNSGEPVHNAIAIMRKYGISQLPVMEDGKFVGSLDDVHLLPALSKDHSARDKAVKHYMNHPFPVVQASDPISTVGNKINEHVGAVLVDLGQGKYHIITRHDLVAAMS
jgi:cystathionine beta-synthase